MSEQFDAMEWLQKHSEYETVEVTGDELKDILSAVKACQKEAINQALNADDMRQKVKELTEKMEDWKVEAENYQAKYRGLLEAKDAEPVGHVTVKNVEASPREKRVFGKQLIEAHIDTLKFNEEGTFNLYTAPPTVSAAVAAFRMKAADIVKNYYTCGDPTEGWQEKFADAILAIPADETSLEQYVQKRIEEYENSKR